MLSDARSRTRLGIVAIACAALFGALSVAIPADADGPVTTTPLGPVLTKDENPVQSSGRDVGLSVALPNGQALWVFGDTSTLEYAGSAWKMTHFIAGSSAAIGPYTAGHVPAPMTEVVVGRAHKPDNQAARFVPAPSNVRIPDGSGRVCNQANGSAEPGARWVTGAALLPDNTNVLVTYVGVCVMPPESISIQSFGFMEYDWVHNTISVAPIDVFAPAVSGASMDRAKMFGSPVVANNQVTLFSETCCSPPADFHVTTIPADVASLSNPASYVTHVIPTLHPAVSGLLDANVGVYGDGQLRLVALTDEQGGYAVYSAPAIDGPWSPTATGTLPGCATSADPCYGIIGHPELSTDNALFLSYYLRGSGPGVPGHPFAQRPLNHVLLASAGLGPGPVPGPAPVPSGQAPSPPTSAKVRSKPTTKPTGSVVVTYKGGSNRGSVILRYTAACTSSNGGVARSAAHAGANVIPITVAGVTTAKRYTCSVRATNGWGASAPSVASAPVIVGAPGAPGVAHVTKLARGKVKVTFAPGANNGAAITRFTPRCTSTNGGVTRAKVATVRSIPITGLTRGKTYTCSVTATNSRGESTPSTPSAATKV
jgi:hypothetical protein